MLQNMGSFKVTGYDTIQCIEINSLTFFVKNRGKETTCFYAVVEEVKHWKSLIH